MARLAERLAQAAASETLQTCRRATIREGGCAANGRQRVVDVSTADDGDEKLGFVVWRTAAREPEELYHGTVIRAAAKVLYAQPEGG